MQESRVPPTLHTREVLAIEFSSITGAGIDKDTHINRLETLVAIETILDTLKHCGRT